MSQHTNTLGQTQTRTGTTRTTRHTLESTRTRRRRQVDSAVKKARQGWGKLIKQRVITPLGIGVLCVTVLSLLAAVVFGYLEGWIVGAFGAILLLLALPFLLGSKNLDVKLALRRDKVFAGDPESLHVLVQNRGAQPALASDAEVHVAKAIHRARVPMLGPNSSCTLEIPIDTSQRGKYEVGPFSLVRRDPLELFRKEMSWDERHKLTVWPQIVRLPQSTAGLVQDLEGEASKRLTDSDISFHAVRDYLPGDQQRHIDWKATAKTGKLMVRQFERTESARVAVLLDGQAANYADGAQFELAVSVATSFAFETITAGRDRVIATSAQLPGQKNNRTGVYEIPANTTAQALDALAVVAGDPFAADFNQLVRNVSLTHPELSRVVLVTGAALDRDSLRRLSAGFGGQTTVSIVRACSIDDDLGKKGLGSAVIYSIAALQDIAGLTGKTGAA